MNGSPFTRIVVTIVGDARLRSLIDLDKERAGKGTMSRSEVVRVLLGACPSVKVGDAINVPVRHSPSNPAVHSFVLSDMEVDFLRFVYHGIKREGSGLSVINK